MTDQTAALMHLREITGSGLTTKVERPAGAKSRPRFRREVLAPAAIFAASGFGLVTGSALAAWFVVGDYRPVLAACCAGLCAASITGGIAALYQLPHYRRLQWVTVSNELPARQPAAGSGRGRLIEQTSPNTKAVTRCEWSPGWRAVLAQKTHDTEGNWTGDVMPVRKLFAGLVTGLSTRYRPNGGDVFADLRDLDYLDDNDHWTDRARLELRSELFIPTGGF